MALEKDRERRYQHATDICSDLKRLKEQKEKRPTAVNGNIPEAEEVTEVKMVKAVSSAELKRIFEGHLEQTRGQRAAT